MERYDPAAVEARWQEIWERERSSTCPTPRPATTPRGSSTCSRCCPTRRASCTWGTSRTTRWATWSRCYRRRNGGRVMHPMGYDAFGLPAENAAIRSGLHPAASTRANIAAIRRQMKRHGLVDRLERASSRPPSRSTTAGRSGSSCACTRPASPTARARPVKWCPNDQTVLANEQVIDGRCERCGAEVEARTLEQWFFKITDYADRLLDDLERGELARAGRDDAAQLDRPLAGRRGGVPRPTTASICRVFTTRPDTLFGATFFVLAPEHPLAARAGRRQRARAGGGRLRPPHRGALGGRAGGGAREDRRLHRPLRRSTRSTASEIPVWVADYVLMEYGTGAIMAVPAHDERDFEFAEAHGLEIRPVVAPRGGGEPRPRAPTSGTARTRC